MALNQFNQFEAAPLWQGGPSPGAFYNFPGDANNHVHRPIAFSQSPITTGTSVLGVHTKDGVVIAADCGAYYGSLMRYRNIDRLMKVNDNILLAGGGDIADFQYIKQLIDQKILDERCTDDGFNLKPKSLYCWLTRVMYKRRSSFDPLWNNLLIAGLEDGKPFLGTVDKLGTAYTNPVVGTGFGSQFATPLLNRAIEENQGLTTQQALDVLYKCFQVLYYRDARSFAQYTVGIITDKGIEIRGPLTVEPVYHPQAVSL